MAKHELKKPEKKRREYYDYQELRNYLEAKYGYKEKDYAGRFKKRRGQTETERKAIPYQDFWCWVVDRYEIHNGCYLTFTREELEWIKEDWVKEIYTYYIDEFADENGDLEMYVWW